MTFASYLKSSSPGVNFLAVIGGLASGLRSWPFKINCFVMPLLFICAALTNLSTQWILNGDSSVVCYHQQSGNLTSDVLVAMCRDQEHNYYLAFLLLLNAAIFVLPELLRLACRGEPLMRQATSYIAYGEQNPTDQFEKLSDYVTYHMNRFRSYVVKRSLCELFCIPICLVQVWMTNWYLGGGFVSYGYQVVRNQFASSNPLSSTSDSMAHLFPNLNKSNRVVYLVVWWALALQALLFAIVMLYRVYLFVCIQLSVSVRERLLQSYLKKLSASESSLSAGYLADICRDNVLDLAVYLMLFACFHNAADLEMFIDCLLAFVESQRALRELEMRDMLAKKKAAVPAVPPKMLFEPEQQFIEDRNFDEWA